MMNTAPTKDSLPQRDPDYTSFFEPSQLPGDAALLEAVVIARNAI